MLSILIPHRARIATCVFPGWLLALLLSAATCSGQGVLFDETFDGYTSFPTEYPDNDWVNEGIPEISEGANEFWYGVRFDWGGSVNRDLAVQRYGGGDNNTPVGRFEDGTGIVLRIDTTGYTDLNLSFIWRTFRSESGDRFDVGYHVGDDLGFDTGDNRFLDLSGTWSSSWVQLLSGSHRDSWCSQSYALPEDAGVVYVAFWLKDGEGDFGKVDNILITGIPEPGTATMMLLGGATLMLLAGRRQGG